MTAEGFLGQLWVSVNVDTAGLANATTEFTRFQQKVITTSKLTQAATAQAANISDARLKQSYNAESQYISGRINNAKQWDATQAKASRQYGSYIKQQITDSKQWEAHQQKWRGVESQYYAQEAAMKNKSLSAYNAAQRLGNTQQNQYWKQQSQEAAAAEKALARSTQGMGVSLNSLSNNLYRFGTFATMAFTLPLAALATLGVKSAVELEQIKAKTVALANVSQEQMDAWSGAITRIGIATNATSKSIAQSLYFVSSAGVDNANAMKMVEFAAKGSAAGLGETDVIAKLLTYTYNAYGKEAFDVVKIMDSLTVAVREGAAEAGDIVAVMGDLIPIGAQLGVSFAQMAGSLAAMTQVGMNAHKSATALRQIMVQLIKPHHDAAAALDQAAKKMGDASIASRNLTATIRDKGLLETLVKIKEAGEKMGPMFLPTVFSNVRAFNGFMAEVGPNLDKVREIMKKTTTETGAFATALGIMTQTSEFKLGQFKKAWELAMLGLGESILPKLLPMLNSLAQTINDLSKWFKSLSGTTQGLILDFGVFLALLGPLTIALSGLVRLWAIIGMAWTGMIIPAIHAVGSALVWLSGVMLANPYVALAAGIALLGVGIYKLIQGSVELIGATDDLIASKRMLKDITDKAAESVLNEKIAIQQYLNVFNGYNATNEQKESALKKINGLSSTYLANLKEEDIGTEKATKAIDAYIASLTRKAYIEGLTAEMNERIKKRTTAVSTGSDYSLSWSQWSEVLFTGGFDAKAKAAKMSLNNAALAANEFSLAMLKLKSEINDYNNNAIVKAEIQTEKLAKTMADAKKTVKDLFVAYREALNSDAEADSKPLQDYLKKLAEIEAKKKLYSSYFSDDVKKQFDYQNELLTAKKTFLDGLIEQEKGATVEAQKLTKEIIALQRAIDAGKSDVSNQNLGYAKGSVTGLFDATKAPGKSQYSNFGIEHVPAPTNALFFQGAIESAKAYSEELIKIKKEYDNTIDKNDSNQISNRRNAPWKIDTDNFKAYVNMMKQYRNLEKDKGNQAGVDEWQKKIDLAMKPTNFQASFQKFNAYFQQIGQGINTMISSYVEMINIKQNAAYAMIDNIAKVEGRTAEWVAKQKEKIDAEYNRKKRQAAIAQAIINGAMAVTNIIANTPGSVLNPLSWVGIGIAAATTAAQIAVISSQKMAMGGVVPSGYNNDTYPALLSSGETVIPASPHKLSSLAIGVGGQVIRLKGEVVHRGKDLVYIIDQEVKLMKSY